MLYRRGRDLKKEEPVETSCNKDHKPTTWREKNRLNIQMAALVLGIIALFGLIFCMENDQTIVIGLCLALTGAVLNIFAWA